MSQFWEKTMLQIGGWTGRWTDRRIEKNLKKVVNQKIIIKSLFFELDQS